MQAVLALTAPDDQEQNRDTAFAQRADVSNRRATRRHCEQVLATAKEAADVAERLPMDDVPLHDEAGEMCLF
jgi:hypothetical protein